MSLYTSFLDDIIDIAKSKVSSDNNLLAVFDLDSTLYNVTKRSQRILHDFSNDPKMINSFPIETEILREIETRHDDWGIRQAIERSGITNPEFFSTIRDYWLEHFFSSPYLAHDLPYAGAVDFVNDLHLAGADIMYLTGRDQQQMHKGTVASLKQWGFPIEVERVKLHLKPNKNMVDSEYKHDILEPPHTDKRKIFFFENEPVIINKVLNSLPKIEIIFMDSVHSGRENSPDQLKSLNMSFLKNKG